MSEPSRRLQDARARPADRAREAGRGWLKWPAASLRAYFVIVILVATVPQAAFVSYLIYQETVRARSQIEDGLRRTAHTFALAVEREIVSSIDALSILAQSDSLQAGDVRRFYLTLTRRPTMRDTWRSAYLVASDGTLLFSTDRPYGAPLGNVDGSPEFDQIKRTREPVVTDLVLGHDTDQLVTGIQVPVLVRGELRYVLGARITTHEWQALMRQASVPKGGFLSLFDANNRVIAHSLDAAPALGHETIPAHAGADGTPLRDAPLVAGTTYAAWHRVPPAGWGVGVGIAAEPFERSQLAAVAAAMGAGLLSLSLGLALALLVARQVTGPLQQLAKDGPQSAPGKIVVREIATLRDALVSSAEQREVARARLQAKADEFEALFTTIPIGLAIAQDPQCSVVLMNPALAAMFDDAPARGASRMEPSGASPAGLPRVFRRGQELPAEQRPLQQACREGVELRDVELDIVHADGRTINVLAYAVPLLDPAGRPRGAIAAFADITERKRAEQRLIDAERQLRESQNLVELAQEAGHVGFFDYHFADDCMVWTSGLAKLFGIPQDQIDPRWNGWAQHVVPDDARAVRQAVDAALAQQAGQATFEFRAQRADGSIRWLASRVLLSYDEHGRPSRMIGVSVDVSDQKLAEQARAELIAREQAARRDAENANRAKDEFLAMLGHELRNPLGAIAAAVEVLNRVGAQNDTAQSARRIISRQTSHLANLMNDLLDMARATAGKINLNRQCMNLVQLVQRPLGALEVSGALKHHHVTVDLQDAWVMVDAMRFEQVVTNLLTNAVKYTPDGGSIHVRVGIDGNDAVLEVRDTGAGIPEALLPRVFDLFVQGERTLDRRQGGLGIGLTLVRRLVELHGGTVQAASPGPNLGSTFTVRLKRATPPVMAVSRPQAPLASRRHVVVVEDNEDARAAIENLLTLAGHRVTTAPDGETGLQKVLEETPDVALIDIGLPGLNGYEVAQRLRAVGHRTRLIALSGYGQPHDIERALTAGFDAHMVKPIDVAMLQNILAGT